VMIVQSQPYLLQVIRAGQAVRGLTNSLHGRQQQSNQHGDDCHNYQQFDKCEATMFAHDLRSIERGLFQAFLFECGNNRDTPGPLAGFDAADFFRLRHID
jgi:hypothetical protein